MFKVGITATWSKLTICKMAKFLISVFGFLWFSGLLNESRNVLKHFTPYYHGNVTFPSFNEKWFKCICDILHMHAFYLFLLLFFLSIALFVFVLIIIVFGFCRLFANLSKQESIKDTMHNKHSLKKHLRFEMQVFCWP